eukprot:2215615-Rhodomonas_salina.1
MEKKARTGRRGLGRIGHDEDRPVELTLAYLGQEPADHPTPRAPQSWKIRDESHRRVGGGQR